MASTYPSFSRSYSLCLYTPARPSPPALGLPSGLWGPPKRPLRHCTTASHTRRRDVLILVRSFALYQQSATLIPLSTRPMRLLRTFPPLEALPVVGIAVTLVRDLPSELYDELVRHPYEYRS